MKKGTTERNHIEKNISEENPFKMAYPEHEKLQKVREKSQAIGEFLDWLSYEKKIHFAKWIKEKTEDKDAYGRPKKPIEYDVFVQQPMQIEEWTAEFYNIDLKELEQEKRQMLDQIRQANDPSVAVK